MSDPNALLANELPYARFLVLELSALLDRLSRVTANGKPLIDDPRAARLRESLAHLAADRLRDDRAESILQLMSDGR